MMNVREYYRPSSPAEAVDLKRSFGARAVYLAGGSDLLVNKPAGIDTVIDIRHTGLGGVRNDNGDYAIGGTAILRDAEDAVEPVAGGMLRQALRETAPWLVRNAATVAGNIANASPAADSVPALLALDAELVLLMNGDDETVPLQSIFDAPHRTLLGDRLIREIRIKRESAARVGAFTKLARSKSDIAQVNVAVTLRRDGRVFRDVRIALGAVAPVPMRASHAEALLEGKEITMERLREAEHAVCEEVRPISDWRASEQYRRRMSGVLVRRALERLTAAESGEEV